MSKLRHVFRKTHKMSAVLSVCTLRTLLSTHA